MVQAVRHNHEGIGEGSMKPELSVVGIDLAKSLFHLVGMDERGKIILRKRLARGEVMPFMAKLPRVLVGMEACGGAHYWARQLREQGHEVQLMAPQYVKPYTYCMARRNFLGGRHLRV